MVGCHDQSRTDAAGSLNEILTFKGIERVPTSQAGRISQQKVPCRPILASAVNAIRDHPVGEPQNRLPLLLDPVVGVGKHGGRVQRIRPHDLLDINCSGHQIGGHDLAEFLLIEGIEVIFGFDRAFLTG